MDLTTSEYLARIGLAFVLGAAIGLERERQPRPAGLRTHSLVAVGSALITLVSAYGFVDFKDASGGTHDPTRIAAQIVSGIGFIGAGAVIAQPDRVRGLTTAASLWSVAAIGLAAGAGLYIPAVATTAIVLVILVPFKYVEDHFLATRRNVARASKDEFPSTSPFRGKHKKGRAHRKDALSGSL